MAPEGVVRATQAWLQSSWHVQVPFAWLEACVEWLQEEAGGAGRLSQQQINQQALDQWLLTDLRDLDYAVLPDGLAQAQKTELRGTFCVQVDSLLDISQPAYGQLQKLRGADCANDEISAVTQITQRPWEARPTRMLLLQVTDGVQSLEAMEYQPVPALSTALRPGAKLQLQGQMVCRLGMLLLGPSNIKVLGGEVEDLADRNNQGKVLCRTLGLPEEEQQQQQDGEEAPPSHQDNQEMEDLELDDQELLASLEAQEEVGRVPVRSVRDSGYGSRSEASMESSRSSSVRSLISSGSLRSEASAHSYRSGLTQSNRGGSVQGHRHSNEQEEPDLFHPLSSDHVIQREITDHSMAEEEFPEPDFDDLPLDELDTVIHQQSPNVTTQSNSGHRGTTENCNRIQTNPNSLDRTAKQTGQLYGSFSQCGSTNSSSTFQQVGNQSTMRATTRLAAPSETCQSGYPLANDERDFMDEDMDCFLEEVDNFGEETERTQESDQPRFQQEPKRDKSNAIIKTGTTGSSFIPTSKVSRSESSHSLPLGQNRTPSAPESDDVTVPVLTLTSRPFTYLCLLEELISRHPHTTEICVKAFIVTLLGKMSSSNGLWRVCATISDGTGYLDVELSNGVLTGLLGFSVAEKGVLKRDPARRGELDAGMRRCQEELVDMCCLMTIAVEPQSRKSVVTKADPVNEEVYRELELRVRDRRR